MPLVDPQFLPPPRRLRLPALCLVLCCIMLPSGQALGWESELAAAEQARQQGRYFAAQDILESLADSYPDSGRIQLELAVLYLELLDFSSARAAVDQVLAQPDLPEAVAVNARLLRMAIERQQARTAAPEDSLVLSVHGGQEAGQIWQLDTRALISRRQYHGQQRLLDRPLRQFWQIALSADQYWQPVLDSNQFRVHPSVSLLHYWADLDSRVGLGLELTDQQSATVMEAQLGWTPLSSFRVYLEHRWRTSSDWQTQTTRIGTGWRFTDNWALRGDWEHQYWIPQDVGAEGTASGLHRTRLGLELNYQATWQAAAGLRAPTDALESAELTATLSVPLLAQRWLLDNRVDLPVSSVGSGQWVDALRWRTGVRWQL